MEAEYSLHSFDDRNNHVPDFSWGCQKSTLMVKLFDAKLKLSSDSDYCSRVDLELIKIGNKECSENGEEVRGTAFIDFMDPEIQSLETPSDLKYFMLSGFKPGRLAFSSDINWQRKHDLLMWMRANKNEASTIYCGIIVKCGIKHRNIVKTLLPCFETDQNRVTVGSTHHSTKILNALYNSRDLSDIVISTEKERIPAHKAILAAQSPVFKAMFQTNMLETRANVVEMKDFDTDIVKGMLEFIYTVEVTDLDDPGKVGDLFRISDKYGLLELKDVCEEKMCSKLNVENAAEFFHLARLHSLKTLKVFALRFIHEKKLEVGETEFFKELVETDPSILLELYLSI